ncbi:macrocin O-methyltransferase [Planktomarina temperata]|nr:macrocin O-methyltransferase [Planktomarina temperata]
MSKVNKLFTQVPHDKDVDDYYHILNSSNVLNAVYWWEFFSQIRGLNGDIVECGVGRGRSLVTIASINKLISALDDRHEREIFALDSFEGFPEPTEFDNSKRSPQKGEWSMSPNNQFKYSPETIANIMKLANVDSKINYVKGFFDKTTENLEVDDISILHLDGDLYESVKTPLNNLWQKVVIGGLVVIDDYAVEETENERFPGARTAIKEFLRDNVNFDYLTSLRGTPYLKRIG